MAMDRAASRPVSVLDELNVGRLGHRGDEAQPSFALAMLPCSQVRTPVGWQILDQYSERFIPYYGHTYRESQFHPRYMYAPALGNR